MKLFGTKLGYAIALALSLTACGGGSGGGSAALIDSPLVGDIYKLDGNKVMKFTGNGEPGEDPNFLIGRVTMVKPTTVSIDYSRDFYADDAAMDEKIASGEASKSEFYDQDPELWIRADLKELNSKGAILGVVRK